VRAEPIARLIDCQSSFSVRGRKKRAEIAPEKIHTHPQQKKRGKGDIKFHWAISSCVLKGKNDALKIDAGKKGPSALRRF